MPERKRKARTEKAPKVETLTPIPLDILGSEDDPCFGKYNDPRDATCQSCGDIEICAIAMGQRNHIKRLKVEASQNFKDMEEKEIPKDDRLANKKLIRKRIRELVEANKNKPDIIEELFGIYGIKGFSKKVLEKIYNKVTA